MRGGFYCTSVTKSRRHCWAPLPKRESFWCRLSYEAPRLGRKNWGFGAVWVRAPARVHREPFKAAIVAPSLGTGPQASKPHRSDSGRVHPARERGTTTGEGESPSQACTFTRTLAHRQRHKLATTAPTRGIPARHVADWHNLNIGRPPAGLLPTRAATPRPDGQESGVHCWECLAARRS